MNINPLKSITFGYNKQFHDAIHDKLFDSGKSADEYMPLILEEKELLAIEDKLVLIEESKNTIKPNGEVNLDYSVTSQALVPQKVLLAIKMNDFFENSDYSKRLASQYLQESKRKNMSEIEKEWRVELSQELSKLDISVENIIDEPVDAKDILSISQADKLKAEQIRAQLASPVLKPQVPAFVDVRNIPVVKEIGPTSFEIEQALKNNLTLHTIEKSSPKGLRDVVAMDELKQVFQEDIIEYINNPELLKLDEEEYGIRPPRGFLFYGPPGCGKTFVAEALAAECDFRMYKMNVSQIGATHVNESANNLEAAFNYLYSVAKGKNKPVLLFMDEVDALARDRRLQNRSGAEDMKTLTTLLKHIEACRDKNIIIFAATNKYDLLDDAFVSRFDCSKYIGLPDIEQIQALLKDYLSKRSKGVELSNDTESIERLAKEMSGYSNRSIVFILDKAKKLAKRDNRSKIKFEHIMESIKTSDLQKIDETKYKKDTENAKKIGFI